MKRLIALAFSYAISLLVAGQNDFGAYHFTHITSKQGLPHNMVFSIAQDKQGFIWFGTNNGLARYDGYSFRIFQPDFRKQNSISGKSVYLLHVDLFGNLWIHLQGSGLDMMDVRTEEFIHYSPENDDPRKLSGNAVNYFYEDSDSILWVATNKGIDVYDRGNARFENCYLRDSKETITGNGILYIARDKNNQLWFLASDGAGQLSPGNYDFQPLGEAIHYPPIDTAQLLSMLLDNNDDLWLTTLSNGFYGYNTSENTIEHYLAGIPNLFSQFMDSRNFLYVYADKPSNKLFIFNTKTTPATQFAAYPMYDGPSAFSKVSFTESPDGNIWISCQQGLKKYHIGTGITDYNSNRNFPITPADNHIITKYVDNSENLWLSIHRAGIDKADLKQKSFKWYLSDPDKKNTIPGDNVVAIFEDSRNNLWIGSYGAGLTRFNPASNIFSTIPIDNKDVSNLIFNAPAALYEDTDGYIWVGFYDGQVSRIHPDNLKIDHYTSFLAPENSEFYFEGWGVRKIMSDSNGNIWFATTNRGLVELNRATKKFIYHSALYEQDYSSNSLYRYMHITRDGMIWTATQNGGLTMYDKGNKKFIKYTYDADDSLTISNNTVYYIFEESVKILWVATALGLNRFDRESQTFTRFYIKNDNSFCALYCIIPDKNNFFWMSSDCGIVEFNKSTHGYRIFIESDGLPATEFSTTGYCITKAGEIFMGTSKGMISFIPGTIYNNPYKAHPIITDLKIFNKSVAPGDTINGKIILQEQIWATRELVLSYKENDFTLNFSALHYAAPEKIQYQYILEGFNTQWIATSSDRRWANFTGLSPGNYTFRLKATNNDGIMSDPEDEVQLDIIIKPPFYKTWWFGVILACFLLSLIFLLIRLRESNLKSQKILLEDMVKERTGELERNTRLLEEKQEEITLQNDELAKHRNELESLVKERTQQLELAKKRAEESDRLKSAFLANMSHEIRTPMNAIVGFSGLLTEEGITDQDRIYYNDIISRNCETLLVLINDILEISKIEADQVKVNKTLFDVIEIFRELENFYKIVNKKGLDIKFTEGRNTKNLIIDNDPIRFRQILSNLLSNAYKYTKKGHIHFGYFVEDKYIKFFVFDTGIGIHKDEYEKIFSPFHKIEPFGQKIHRGTGIGLSISKSLVKLMNGKIWLESEEGKGSTFYFTLPYDDQIQNAKEAISYGKSRKSKIPDLSKYKILIAEDEPTNFQLIKKIMQRVNSEVIWAQNGLEAVNFIKEHPDVLIIILMDIKMQVMDGIEACEKIRELRPDIPIIAVTAYAQELDKSKFLNLGFHGYISKPLKPNDIIEAIKNIL